ncbi:MAG: YigZ family protein [bacterium]
MAALEAAGVRDALIVVTRWFGGTKLGTGGLAHAYGDAARAALDAAPRRDVWLETLVLVDCAWSDVGAVEAVLAREGERVRRCDRTFDPSPRFAAALVRSRADAFREAIREATSGRARLG